MADAAGVSTQKVIPVWGLMPDERDKITARARKYIRERRASKVSKDHLCSYICVFDEEGAPYTIGREQRILHLLGPSGETIAVSKKLDPIIAALDSSLGRHSKSGT